MVIAENILYFLAKRLYNTEIALTDEMKDSLTDMESYGEHRSDLFDQIKASMDKYDVSVEGLRVVDFGCNDGSVTSNYLELGASHVTGLDVDAEAIERAKQVYTDERLDFKLSAVDSIPLEDNSVDVLISDSVFEHVSDPERIFSEIHRVLAPGGMVLTGTWGWWHPFAPHLWSTMPVPWVQVFFSEKTILKVCRRVYLSDWYKPNMHDFDEQGERIPDKYTHERISTDYINKYLIKDFERAIDEAGLKSTTYPVPFGSKYASWTRIFLGIPYVREFVAGYVWFVGKKTA